MPRLAGAESIARKAEMSEQVLSYDPANGSLVGKVAATSPAELETMIARSRRAQKNWARRSPEERAACILPAAAKLREAADELAHLITREMGKPVKEARSEVMGMADQIEAKLPEIVSALQPSTVDDAAVRSVIYREALGVCAAIAPWNFPLYEPLDLAIPALAAGNAVLLKPSEVTPLTGAAAAEILNHSLPPSVLQVVQGGEEQGKALVRSDGVDLVAFTGSRAAGKHILQAAAAGNLKRVILELGGKNAMIVLDDADIDAAAKFTVRDAFRVSGQVCVSTQRIYVDEKIADRFIGRVGELARQIRVGNGLDDVDYGPLISSQQKQAVARKIAAAKSAGAKAVIDGSAQSAGADAILYPTVLVDVDQSSEIMREETFGPVACIARFRNVEDAIRLANDTPYGLGAVVFGRDTDRALLVGRELEAGMVGINKSCHGAKGTPWVGIKQSGYGWHSGIEGHRQFTVPRVVSRAKGD